MTAVHLAALATACVASVSDIRTRRIPNWLTLGSAIAALVAHGIDGGVAGLGHSAAGWLAGLLVFFIPFALRGLGGGDVKLMAALGAWVGPWDVLWLALYTGIAGGILALGIAVARGYLTRACANIWLLLCHWRVAGFRPDARVSLDNPAAPKLAYAIPIFIGTATVLWLR